MNQIGSVLPTRANDLFTDEEIEEIVSSEQGLPNGNQVSRGDEALEENESPTLSPQSPTLDIPKLKSAIHAMKDQLDGMLRMLNGEQSSVIRSAEPDTDVLDGGERIIEGVFNGEKMVGPDGKEYAVSPNYASKSKIVEGDMMKLTITNNGKFIFKQIGPVERKTRFTALGRTRRWQGIQNPQSLSHFLSCKKR
jgi:hypothetical protein